MRADRKERRSRSPIHVIEREFNEALDRLLAAKPRDPKLKRLAGEGRLAINPTTVAQEANRSRTLIALEVCRLPSVRNRILMAARDDEVAAPRTAAEVITRLREQVVKLKRELTSAMAAQAHHFLEREKAEREAAKWRDALKRLREEEEQKGKIKFIR